ncbi:hypothetical protein HBI56_021740 [Parastagonospora nodorum]|uniref:Uncharacterized protein n=1 Tax=Phaeosphaeria nodorum (strain SN15 / ATCC MYA-4574 / FGSC 10173) TaxID=321614 RepID=A0A7U2HZP4_PHANO|nr:hypothetical protein HBH56_174710 [Parastagonospora nodorum]QRC96329.1 hypothetical protein JI435_408740 [Parastagonospora nodorum SN15]KAH3926244.1 hypothetical protein HBH54_168440 [Parastagonospora nodorum]KAH3955342.1 hypothetical protein HBH53_001250 [Parastagonospora nodorum]KAH3965669.1 hypothetical protein HBH52_205100 [Parastagonospora nodorum]
MQRPLALTSDSDEKSQRRYNWHPWRSKIHIARPEFSCQRTSCARRLGGAQRRGMRGLSVELRLSPQAEVKRSGGANRKDQLLYVGRETSRKRDWQETRRKGRTSAGGRGDSSETRGTRMTLTGR